MSPMIPGEGESSAFPGAVFTFTAKNNINKKVDLRLMEGQMNFVGWDGVSDAMGSSTPFWGGNVNSPFSGEHGLSGLSMTSSSVKPDAAPFGSICVAALQHGDDLDFVKVGDSSEAPQSSTKVIMQATSEEDLWAQFV